MVDRYLKVLEYQDSFPQGMENITDAFISFYGEEKKDAIMEKFNDAVIIPYIPLDELKSLLYKIKKEKTSELKERIKEKVNMPDKDFSEIFQSPFFSDNLMSSYYKYVDEVKEANDPNYSTRFLLSGLDQNITAKNILDGNLSDLMKQMDEVRTFVKELEEEYDEVLTKIDKYEKMCNLDSFKYDILSKYVYEFASKHRDLLGEEFDKIEQDYNKTKRIYISNYPKLEMYFGHMDTVSKISSFDEESDEKINNAKVQYIADSIKRDRIKYFKMMGIDLGDDYSLYEKSEECKNLYPSKELIDTLKQEKEEYTKSYKKVLLEHYPIYSNSKKIIDKIPFTEDVDLVSIFDEGIMCVSPNIFNENGLNRCKPIVFLNLGRDLNVLDASIVHEFNHVFELNTLDIKDNEYHLICGWDLINIDKEKESDASSRKYEMINEIVNDLISEQICRIMHSKNQYLYSSKDDVNYNSNNYRRTTFLVSDFISKFKTKILDSRNGDMSVITNYVGSDNFEELNNLFFEFNTQLGGQKYYQWHEDIKNEKKTELTEKREEIERRRDEIIERMYLYSLEQQKKTM